MRKTVAVIMAVFCAFLCEMVLFNLWGSWYTPNFILLLVIFFNLSFGIRYGISAAVFGGLLRDSFSPGLMGLNLFSLLVSAYVTTWLVRHMVSRGSLFYRLMIVFIVTFIHFLCELLVYGLLNRSLEGNVVMVIFLPEMVLTLLVCHPTLTFLKKCALKLFV